MRVNKIFTHCESLGPFAKTKSFVNSPKSRFIKAFRILKCPTRHPPLASIFTQIDLTQLQDARINPASVPKRTIRR